MLGLMISHGVFATAVPIEDVFKKPESLNILGLQKNGIYTLSSDSSEVFKRISQLNLELNLNEHSQEEKAQLILKRGILNYLNENLRRASEDFETVTNLAPDQLLPHLNLALVFIERGDLLQAMACFEKVIEIDPKYLPAYENLIDLLLKDNNIEAAYQFIEKANQQALKSEYLSWGKALIHTLKNQPKEAILSYQQAITLNPQIADLYLQLSWVFQSVYENKSAIECYQKGLLALPKNTEISIHLALSYWAMDDLNQALKILKKTTQTVPESPYVHFHLAKLHSELNQNEQALVHLDKVMTLEIKPLVSLKVNVYTLSGKLYQKQMQYKKAIGYYSDSLALNPDQEKVLLKRSTCYLKQKQFKAALNDLVRCYQLNPNDELLKIIRGLEDLIDKEKSSQMAV